MRIGLVCPYNIMRGGGVQECVLALKDELTKRGHEVKVISPTPPKGQKLPSDKNIILVGGAAEIKSPFHTTAEISASANGEQLKTVLEKERFDILHFHEPTVPMLSRQLLSRSTSINVATYHAKLPETTMSRTIERVITPYTKSILKNIHALTAVSDAAAEYVRSLTKESVSIIPNGIDLRKYKIIKKTQNHRRKTILYIGRLEKRKGVKYLLQAYDILSKKRKDIKLVLAGDGPDKLKLEQYIKDNSIPNVFFLGWVTESKKLRLLQEADVFCSPAIFGESFGIVLLEAMATGTVTVAGDNPGYASVMIDKGAFSLVNPKDTTELARRLSLFLDDRDLQRLWKQWAKEYVKQFDYKKVVNRYEDLYKRLFAASKSNK